MNQAPKTNKECQPEDSAECNENLIWDSIARKRDIKNARYVSHESAWRAKTVPMLRGLGKEVWQSLGGADYYIKQERASWNK